MKIKSIIYVIVITTKMDRKHTVGLEVEIQCYDSRVRKVLTSTITRRFYLGAGKQQRQLGIVQATGCAVMPPRAFCGGRLAGQRVQRRQQFIFRAELGMGKVQVPDFVASAVQA